MTGDDSDEAGATDAGGDLLCRRRRREPRGAPPPLKQAQHVALLQSNSSVTVSSDGMEKVREKRGIKIYALKEGKKDTLSMQNILVALSKKSHTTCSAALLLADLGLLLKRPGSKLQPSKQPISQQQPKQFIQFKFLTATNSIQIPAGINKWRHKLCADIKLIKEN